MGWFMDAPGRRWKRHERLRIDERRHDRERFGRPVIVVVNVVTDGIPSVPGRDELEATLGAPLHRWAGRGAFPFILCRVFATLSGVTTRRGGRSSSLSDRKSVV